MLPAMLKITVSLVPGGVGTERKLGELHIGNVGGGALADYECVLYGDDLPGLVRARVRRYPRWSASVWDLVGRAIAIAQSLSGQERLPRRPAPVSVPIHADGNLTYVRMRGVLYRLARPERRPLQYISEFRRVLVGFRVSGNDRGSR
jgi:hypothetical protein